MSPTVARVWCSGALAILSLAAFVRVTQIPQVFLGDAVLPASGDAAYHLHRIAETVATFPHVPVLDPMLNWPQGGPCPWAPGFDLMGAALVKLVGAANDPARLARTASLLPVLIGLILIACTMCVARRLVPDPRAGIAVGWASGVVLALAPQSVSMARIARVDHHVAEALSMALLGGWVLWGVRGLETRGERIRFELAGATVATWAGVTFSGAPLYVAIATVVWIGAQLLRPDRGGLASARILGSGGPALLVSAGGLALANQPAIAEHGHLLSYQFPSWLQPALYVLAGVASGAAQLALPLGRSRKTAATRALERAAWLGVAGLGVVVCVYGFVPAIFSEVWAGASEWLFTSDPWLAHITEFQPLTPAQLYTQYGVFGVLSPFALALGGWRAWRAHPPTAAAFIAWTLLLVPLALLQRRFGRIFVVNLSIVFGLATTALVELTLARTGRATARALTPAAIGVCILLAMGLLDPVVRKRLFVAEAREPSAIESAALFLRELSSEREDPARGVLTDWEFGNEIIWLAKLPVVAGGFGHYTGAEGFRAIMQFPHMTPERLIALMDRRRLRYLVTGSETFLRVPSPDARSPFRRVAEREGALNPPYFRSLPLAPTVLGGSGLPEIGVPHLAHLRPRFASPRTLRHLPFSVPTLWVYERVPGARLIGRAPPGTRVYARIHLYANDFAVPYTAWTTADRDGRYRLVTPVPSGEREGPLRSDPFYAVTVGENPPQPVAVPRQAVVLGQTLESDRAI